MRLRIFGFCLVISLAALPLEAKPLIGGPKTIAVEANGTVAGSVASAMMGQGSYTSGATKVAVPLIAVAFETSAEARISHGGHDSITTKSLSLRLSVDNSVLQAICAELQDMVEKDLAAQGFEILPKESIDTEARWLGIAKDGKVGEDVKDNFMSGFMGNGSMNRWYTAGNRPLFGAGATGALSETSALIRTARERKISLLCYRPPTSARLPAPAACRRLDIDPRRLLHETQQARTTAPSSAASTDLGCSRSFLAQSKRPPDLRPRHI